MDFEKERSAGYLANHMARLLARGLGDRIRPYGLVIGQFPILLELWAEDGLTQAALVERLDVEQATIANTLSRMERDGLVRRVPHPHDRRARCVVLTDRAKALEGPATAAASAQNAAALTGFSEAERATFLSLMARAIANMRSPDNARDESEEPDREGARAEGEARGQDKARDEGGTRDEGGEEG
ncbi:MarR family winged helix-turn-helix transcriptional regulator [Acuticoccus mangrovi]|uniref:MarR family transcriptional regulator n=1 Tax=Acuticoccus mangrovi TaxID=2796142 RepID=A0A934IMV0_9HYPH|nr:MarR family transcriptional regulator [Acuticoccus mangrovi]